MAWTNPVKTWVVGAVLPAAELNTYVRDNGNASPNAISTGVGDLTYSTAAYSLKRLPIGSTGQVLMVTAGAPAWVTGPNKGYFLGYSGTGYHEESATVAMSSNGQLAVNFSQGFTGTPSITCTYKDSRMWVYLIAASSSGFTAGISNEASSFAAGILHWHAVGAD